MITSGILLLLGLLAADVRGVGSSSDRASSSLVVVALPANANRAMLEALNRLRGEAVSVGFEVRFVDAGAEVVTLAKLEELSRGLHPAAVVAFAGPVESASDSPRSLDVSFMDRASGKISVAHLSAGESPGGEARGDVIIAVRAVDFIRARMFDTLVDRRSEPTEAPLNAPPASVPSRRGYLLAGVNVLGTTTGFQPAITPILELGYRPIAWARISVLGFGLGTQPSMDSAAGSTSLDQRFVGLSATLLGSEWRHMQPTFALAGGEFWVTSHGVGRSGSQGQSITLSSPGALATLGLAFNLLPYCGLELRGGTLWLQDEPIINGTTDTYLGSLGRPTYLGGLYASASF